MAAESAIGQMREQLGALPVGTSLDSATLARINELAEDVAALKTATPLSSSVTSGDNGASAARLNQLAEAVKQIQDLENAVKEHCKETQATYNMM